MKRCPECRRDYYDETLLYCLDDGSALLDGPASGDGAGTAVLRDMRPSGEPETQGQIDPTQLLSTANSVDRSFNLRFLLVPFVLILLGVGVYFTYKYLSPAKKLDSIAVLPLINAGGDPASDYLSDGISESLINSLSRVPGLRVVPRSTVFRYKGQNVDPAEIGRTLGVQAVLTGRVVQHGDTLDVQAELIDVSHDAQTWGERYSRKVTDVQAIQKDILTAVVQKLSSSGGGEQPGVNTYTTRSDAYEEYLRGQFEAAKRDNSQTDTAALAHFKRAAEIDPNFAAAHAAIASMYTELSSVTIPPGEAMPKAKDAVLKALAIDPSLADAHRSLAQIYWWGDWNFAGAEAEFRRAIELNPNDPLSFSIYGNFLARLLRADEAEAAAKRAGELDPTAVAPTIDLCRAYFYSRRFDAMFPVVEKLVIDAPENHDAYYFRATAYLKKGRYEEALADAKRAVSAGDFLSELGYTYGMMGRRADALGVVAQIRGLAAQNRFVSPYEIARVYSGMGDKEAAFTNLEEAYQIRDDGLTRLKGDLFMDNIRDDPRYADLMKRVGLP